MEGWGTGLLDSWAWSVRGCAPVPPTTCLCSLRFAALPPRSHPTSDLAVSQPTKHLRRLPSLVTVPRRRSVADLGRWLAG